MNRREVAWRIMPKELYDSSLLYPEDEEDDKATRYVVTPLGAMVNRIYFVGVVEDVRDYESDDGISHFYNARIKCGAGWNYFIGAGKYQPDMANILANFIDKPADTYLAVVAKAKLQRMPGTDEFKVNLRPEAMARVDKVTYEHWLIDTAAHTTQRLSHYLESRALSEPTAEKLMELGIPDQIAHGLILARDHYGAIDISRYAYAVRDILNALSDRYTTESETNEFVQKDSPPDEFLPDTKGGAPVASQEESPAAPVVEAQPDKQVNRVMPEQTTTFAGPSDNVELPADRFAGEDLDGSPEKPPQTLAEMIIHQVKMMKEETRSGNFHMDDVISRCEMLGATRSEVRAELLNLIKDGFFLQNGDELELI